MNTQGFFTFKTKHKKIEAAFSVIYGIIKIKYQGLPKKRYFKFDTTMLQKLYADFQSYLFQPRGDTEHAAPQESTRVANNYIQF